MKIGATYNSRGGVGKVQGPLIKKPCPLPSAQAKGGWSQVSVFLAIRTTSPWLSRNPLKEKKLPQLTGPLALSPTR